MLAQTAHSVEEYVFRLYDVWPPARAISSLISDDRARGFAVANAAFILFGSWAYVARVRARHPSWRGWAWFWTIIEAGNGIGHLLFAAAEGGYYPGAATAPLLLGLAFAMGRALVVDESVRP